MPAAARAPDRLGRTAVPSDGPARCARSRGGADRLLSGDRPAHQCLPRREPDEPRIAPPRALDRLTGQLSRALAQLTRAGCGGADVRQSRLRGSKAGGWNPCGWAALAGTTATGADA